MPPDPLTPAQSRVLDFVRRYFTRQGMTPTLTEIANGMGFASPNAAAKHLAALAQKGHLELLASTARGIRLPEQAAMASMLSLPVVGTVAAGQPILSDDAIETERVLDKRLFRPTPRYLLRVRGHSMREIGILDGDLIGVRPTPEAEHGQIVVARLGEEGITVKKLYRKGRVLRLLPANPEFAPIDPDPNEDFAIEGLYCGLIRGVAA